MGQIYWVIWVESWFYNNGGDCCQFEELGERTRVEVGVDNNSDQGCDGRDAVLDEFGWHGIQGAD